MPLLFAFAQAPAPATGDPIQRLQRQLSSGEKTLRYESGHGYLKDLLKTLDIDPSSQTLVFSKSSMQSDHIGPKTPRAIYFNEHTYVGWIPGAPLIEIMSVDPRQGIRFYTLPNKPVEALSFTPETRECIPCHGGTRLIARSSHTPASGYPRAFSAAYMVSGRTPFPQRWGGWYVSGTHGGQRHMGNELSVGSDENPKIDREKGANVTDLSRYFDTKPYLNPHSDIVALMVMEHQMDLQNILAQTRRRTQNADPTTIADEVNYLIEALLDDEVALGAPVKGTSEFASVYAKRAPRDRQGRALTDLDLKTRLHRYPCSPLIYSESFDALPDAARAHIWRRFREIFDGKDTSGEFDHLTTADRTALREILRDTKPEFAAVLSRP